MASVNSDKSQPRTTQTTPSGQPLEQSQTSQTQYPNDPVSRWTEKLLDLSLRNRLLNAKPSPRIIPIFCSDISQLEDQLAQDQNIVLNSLEKYLPKYDLPEDSEGLLIAELPEKTQKLLNQELTKQRLCSPLPEKNLKKQLTTLYRQAKTDLEEGGVNTLFLAIGFLQWKPTPKEKKTYDAPILLMPVKLNRKTITEGIRISRLDEDTMVNETLLALLHGQCNLDIPGLNPLPMDASGVDVTKIMQIFRQSISHMDGWTVKEEVRLGHFSFGKFIMWNDMTARIDELKANPLVSHLIAGGGIYDDHVDTFPPEEIGKHLNLQELFCPMSADSSQLAAVIYSQLGKSFVLHGPPGTGKSQTITNIIAHNLTLGRRVLFVSEKKAALDVVHKRLSMVGLRPFCLELHSNKSGKTEVLAQFTEALEVPNCQADKEWEHAAKDMTRLRNELNDYVTELHRTYPNGLTAYDCFSQMLDHPWELPDKLITVDCLKQSQEDRDSISTLIADISRSLQSMSPQAVQALPWLPQVDWSLTVEQNFIRDSKDLLEAITSLQSLLEQAYPNEDISQQATLDDLSSFAKLIQAIKECDPIPADIITDDVTSLKNLVAVTQAHLSVQDLTAKLHSFNLEPLSQLDVPGLTARIQEQDQAFFLIRWIKHCLLVRELSSLKKLGAQKLTMKELRQTLPLIQELQDNQKLLDQDGDKAAEMLGNLWQDQQTDWQAIKRILSQTLDILLLTIKLSKGHDTLGKTILEQLKTMLPEARSQLAEGTPQRKAVDNIACAIERIQLSYQTYNRLPSAFPSFKTLGTMAQALQKLPEVIPELRAILLFRKLLEQAEQKGIKPLADLLLEGTLPSEDASDAFQFAYCREMITQIIPITPTLANFSGPTQERKIQDFCNLDKQYTELTKNIIFAKLAAQLPRRRNGDCPEGTELGILKRECKKRARQKPVRQLLEQIPNLVKVLKPCFLMSPLSVAQYLPPNTDQFDLIVFDEASQIPVWDAIGVIARGKQLIVVGDPQQMPPTNFFQKGEADNDDDDSEQDLESILDECIAAGVHSTYLNWHYRSRHESLISFSNHYYYEDKLFTFPAAKLSTRMGIKFQFVPDGTYERTKSRTNRKEAEALVSYVFQQLEEHVEHERSIGVVTFSQAQKDLIEDLMERERAKHPKLEDYFSDQNEEPPFVKNLENVQGDERDVILFSIGYAPDEQGKFTMNFGPLNRQGGERRLNVAITRAKEQVVVFSSIHGTQIDLNRTQATGAEHLKYFLDYAEKGMQIKNEGHLGQHAEGLADTISNFLAENGYDVERNVGCSGFRIDLAVRHPQHPEQYLLGIECDGPAYAQQKTTRDRDHLRDSVLRNLGWHTYRAWTVDWAFDTKRTQQNLIKLLKDLQKQTDMVTKAPASTDVTHHDQTQKDPEPIGTVLHVDMDETTEPPPPERQRTYVLWTPKNTHSQDDFLTPSKHRTLKKELNEIITTEGPICQHLLKKRIFNAWGIARTTDQIIQVLQENMPQNLKQTQLEDQEPVFWPKNVSPQTYDIYRTPGDEEYKRSLEEIPPEELANAMKQIIQDFVSCEQDTLYRETIKLFGFTVLTAKARKILDNAWQLLPQEAQ